MMNNKIQILTILFVILTSFHCYTQTDSLGNKSEEYVMPPPEPPPLRNKILTRVKGSQNLYDVKGFHKDYNLLKTEKGYCIHNKVSNTISTYHFDDIKKQADYPQKLNLYEKNHDYYLVRIKLKYGLINSKGELRIPIEYETLSSYCARKDGKWGVVTPKNEVLIPFIYERLEPQFLTGTLRATLGNKQGLIDKNGNKLIECKYKYITSLSKKYYLTSISEPYIGNPDNRSIGVVDMNGNVILKNSFREIKLIGKDYFKVRTKKEKYGVVKAGTGFTLKPIYKEFKATIRNSTIIAKKKDKYGIVTYDGEILIDFIYDSMEMNQEFFKASRNNKMGFIGPKDKKLKEMTPFIYDTLDDFSSSIKMNYKNNDNNGYLEFDYPTESFKSYPDNK